MHKKAKVYFLMIISNLLSADNELVDKHKAFFKTFKFYVTLDSQDKNEVCHDHEGYT